MNLNWRGVSEWQNLRRAALMMSVFKVESSRSLSKNKKLSNMCTDLYRASTSPWSFYRLLYQKTRFCSNFLNHYYALKFCKLSEELIWNNLFSHYLLFIVFYWLRHFQLPEKNRDITICTTGQPKQVPTAALPIWLATKKKANSPPVHIYVLELLHDPKRKKITFRPNFADRSNNFHPQF